MRSDFSWFRGSVDKKLLADYLKLLKQRRRCPTCGQRRKP